MEQLDQYTLKVKRQMNVKQVSDEIEKCLTEIRTNVLEQQRLLDPNDATDYQTAVGLMRSAALKIANEVTRAETELEKLEIVSK